MKRNGFTLIELLAVIVILAIIALIATPIILGIINDAREESNKRSIELYASAVRNAVAAYQLTGTSVPTKFTDLDVEYDGDVVCSVQELYEDGSFYLEGCKVNDGEKEYSYGTKKVKLNDVCEPSQEQLYATNPLEAGYKYECKVDPNKEPYSFFVLNSNSKSVNLIMDSNINKSGEAVKEGIADRGLLSWITKEDYLKPEIGGTEAEWDAAGWYGDQAEAGNTNKGPITPMNYLQTATKDWENVNTQTINKFEECDSNVVCVDKFMPKTYNTKARMPYLSEISITGCTSYEEGSCPNWVANSSPGTVIGYWLFASCPINASCVWYVDNWGFQNDEFANYYWEFGVRPVINLSL